MNKIKAVLLSAAVVIAIGGAFATSQPNDPCLTEQKFRAQDNLPVELGYSCTNTPPEVCTYVTNPANPTERIPCEDGSYIPPQN